MVIGYDYTISGWCRNKPMLDSENKLICLLNSICHAIGMRSLSNCSVHVEADLKRLGRERFEDEGGATAVLVLSTSHIAIHGWPHRDKSRDDGGFFWLSVCSCREFDPDIVDDIIYKSLGTTKINRSFNHILS